MIPVNLPEEGELRLLDSAEPTSCLARAHNRITCAARMASESLLTLLKRVNRIFTDGIMRLSQEGACGGHLGVCEDRILAGFFVLHPAPHSLAIRHPSCGGHVVGKVP